MIKINDGRKNTRLMKLNQIITEMCINLYLCAVKISLILFSAISRIGLFLAITTMANNGQSWIVGFVIKNRKNG